MVQQILLTLLVKNIPQSKIFEASSAEPVKSSVRTAQQGKEWEKVSKEKNDVREDLLDRTETALYIKKVSDRDYRKYIRARVLQY